MDVVYDEENFVVSPEIKDAYDKKGYLIVRQMMSLEEIRQILRNYEQGDDYKTFSIKIEDSAGRHVSETRWNSNGYDVTGMAVRTHKMVETSSQLLEDEVYHYFTKFVTQEAKTGGEIGWHQEYGQWYNDPVPLPDIVTAYIAVDSTHKIQVLEGSNNRGKIDHVTSGKVSYAMDDEVQQLKESCPFKDIELNPGDILFLHCNTLQRSEANTSDSRRVSLLPVYNRKTNSPTKKSLHPGYFQLDVVYNDAVLDCENYSDLSGKDFVSAEDWAAQAKAVMSQQDLKEERDTS